MAKENVLILGGGDGLALREVLRYGDVREVTLVDIDAAMIRLASQHPEMIRLNRAAFHDARVSAAVADGVTTEDETVTIACPGHGQWREEDPPVELANVHAKPGKKGTIPCSQENTQ